MGLNCKPGDLAFFVRSEAGNEGKVVRCVNHIGVRLFISKGGTIFEDDAWEVDPPHLDSLGGVSNIAPGSFLRPIRDTDGEDETLSWASKPETVSQ